MPDTKSKQKKCNHSNAIFQLFNSISYCMICSSFIFTNSSSLNSTVKAVKPNNFGKNLEIPLCFIWLSNENNLSNDYYNKKDYLKQRTPIIKNIKKICSYFSLSLKTYFLSVEYFDKICTKLSFFNSSFLFQIYLYCIIFASKFNEQTSKALLVQTTIKNDISRNYSADEIYVLNLLNYELNMNTSYDILIDILQLGFIFEGEQFNYNKMNYIYTNIEKILYIFSEMNSYINMTHKQIAICIIGFARELLGLEPFSDIIKKVFLINQNNEREFVSGLQVIKKHIKIQGNKNNKTTETNSINFREQNIKKEEMKTSEIFCNDGNIK